MPQTMMVFLSIVFLESHLYDGFVDFSVSNGYLLQTRLFAFVEAETNHIACCQVVVFNFSAIALSDIRAAWCLCRNYEITHSTGTRFSASNFTPTLTT